MELQVADSRVLRTICPCHDACRWNWAAPYDIGCNCIWIEGKTCIAFASTNHSRETVQAVRDAALARIMAIIDGTDGGTKKRV